MAKALYWAKRYRAAFAVHFLAFAMCPKCTANIGFPVVVEVPELFTYG
jgi:hypothetical protein